MRPFGRALRAVFRTWSIEAELPDGARMPARDYPFPGHLFALCERDAIALAGIIVDRAFTVLAARGRDGDLAAAALAAIGCRVVRGATRRGGASALRRLAAEFAAGDAPGGIVVDGPLGPDAAAQPGILWCARATGRPVVPLGVAVAGKIVFRRSWSKIALPLPFARIAVVCGESLRVPADTPDGDLAALAAELSRRLLGARRRAEGFAAELRAPSTAGNAGLAPERGA